MTTLTDLPLFPLSTVLFPQGLLPLRIFEARYLDMVTQCLREGSPFGVVTLTQGHEVRQNGEKVRFEPQGCLAHVVDCDSPQVGILQIRCRGGQRFVTQSSHQAEDGLWRATVTLQAPDEPEAPRPHCQASVTALERAIAALQARDQLPFWPPYALDEAGWVANRWCELLPLPLPTRLKLMWLGDPQARLELVDGFLRRHRIIDAAE